jgi:hypothetical protein
MMTKYGAKPEQTAKTAAGAPGTYKPKPEAEKTLKERIRDAVSLRHKQR